MPIVLATAVMVRSKVTETWWKACAGIEAQLQKRRSVMQLSRSQEMGSMRSVQSNGPQPSR